MFVQDETAGVFVYHIGERLPLQTGQFVQVTGLARPGRYSPILDSLTIQPQETGPKLNPKPVSLAQIYLGGLDAQWVELTGVVRAQEISENRLRLTLVDPPYRASVWIPDYQGYQQMPLLPALCVSAAS